MLLQKVCACSQLFSLDYSKIPISSLKSDYCHFCGSYVDIIPSQKVRNVNVGEYKSGVGACNVNKAFL